MAQTIRMKRSAVQGKAPTTADLDLGEIAINTYDGKLYLKKDDGTESIVELNSIPQASVDNWNEAYSWGDHAQAGYVTLAGSQTITGEKTFTGNLLANQIQITGGNGSQGTITWNSDEETLDIVQNGAILQVGQEIYYRARNNSGATITEGTPVMATGSLGASGRITIAPMDGTDLANAKRFIGIATEDIANGTDGKITHFGKVRDIDTSAWSEGDLLYVSSSAVGELTNVEPSIGMKLPIAIVINTHANNGTINIRSHIGTAMRDLHDVDESGLSNGDVLQYNSTSGNWETQTTSNWDAAYNWGDHSTAGYVEPDTDVSFSSVDIGAVLRVDTDSVATTSQTVLTTIDSTEFSTIKALVQASQGVEVHSTELLIVHNSYEAIATEYATLKTAGSLMNLEVDLQGGNVRILTTNPSATSTDFNISLTLLKR